MELTGLGGGVMLAIAAVLWLVYLLPTWLRNREYLATEKNAVRLQQTIRVLAETAEVPTVVRAETLARELAAQRPVGPVAVGRAAIPAPPSRATTAQLAARRRRTRAIAAVALLGAIVVGVVQLGMMLTGGIAAGAWVVLVGSALVGITSVAMLRRLARGGRCCARRGLLTRPTRPSRGGVARPSRSRHAHGTLCRVIHRSRPGRRAAAPAAATVDSGRGSQAPLSLAHPGARRLRIGAYTDPFACKAGRT